MITEQYVLDFATQLGIQPRDYQGRLISKVVNGFNVDNFKSILLESPTGSGKTIMGLTALKIIEQLDPTATFGWVAMRTKLLDQAAKENAKIGVKNIEYVSMFTNNPPKCKYIITDEAQHDSADTCATLHHDMDAIFSLGLTATPFRTDKIKLAYEKILNDCGVRFLIEKGYLSEFRQFVIKSWEPREVCNRFLEDPKRWGKSIMYFQDKHKCYEAEKYLLEGGIKAAVLLGNFNNTKREEIYEKFENNETQVLINVYLLTEGFDAPDLQTVWVRPSGKLCTMQMAGRVLRKDPSNPGKIANIIQSDNTTYPYSKTAKAHNQFIHEDGRWLSIEAGPQVENVSALVRKTLLTKSVSVPRYLETGGGTIGFDSKGKMVVKRSKVDRSRSFVNFGDE